MTTSLLVKGACPHDCPDTCGVVTEVRDGRAVAFRGDADHPVTRGWLCAKVRPYLDHVYHPGRVLYPMRRSGPKGSGQWQRVTWEEAIAEIAGRWRDIIAESGAEAILPYSYSGTLGLVQNAAGVVDVIEVGPHLGAQPAARARVLRVAAESDGVAIDHVGQHAAGVGAVVRAGPADQEGRCHRLSALRLG